MRHAEVLYNSGVAGRKEPVILGPQHCIVLFVYCVKSFGEDNFNGRCNGPENEMLCSWSHSAWQRFLLLERLASIMDAAT